MLFFFCCLTTSTCSSRRKPSTSTWPLYKTSRVFSLSVKLYFTLLKITFHGRRNIQVVSLTVNHFAEFLCAHAHNVMNNKPQHDKPTKDDMCILDLILASEKSESDQPLQEEIKRYTCT